MILLEPEKAVRMALELGADYAEIRAENIERLEIIMRNDELHISTRETGGFGVRVLLNGAWGFFSANSEPDLQKAVKMAVKMARINKGNVKLAGIRPVNDVVKSPMKFKPSDVPLEEKMEFLQHILKKLPFEGVRSRTIAYRDFEGKKTLITSEGTKIEWELAGIRMEASVIVSTDGRDANLFEIHGSVERGFEAMDEFESKLTTSLKGQVNAFLHGKKPKLHDVPVLVSPYFAGFVAHEALGHLVEADLFPNTPLSGKIGERIAPEFVHLSDGNVKNGHGNDVYDDEGVPVRKVEPVKDGILRELLVNRAKAFEFGLEPNGHARAQSYAHEPIIRMRNTYFEPADWSLDELVSEVKRGYYLMRPGPGQTGFDSSFTVAVLEGYLIENGEIKEPIFNATASGVALEALRNIRGLGRELEFENSYCGKGQVVTVSMGGPHVLFERGIRVV